MRTVTIYLDKNEKQTTKEKAWTVVTKVYNDAGNLQRTGYTLGEAQLRAAAPAAGGFTVVSESGEENADVEAKIRARAEAKKAKNFAEADRIRDELKAAGIEVTDVPGGAKWKRV